MEPRNIEIDYKERYEKAIIEIDQMAETIEMQEARIAQREVQIENQRGIIRGLEKRKEELCDYYEGKEREIDILKAQMDVVRMIFGGRGNG